jgi:MinD-like ATPase involved in chromosome partitioning or flagellar assembly
MHAELGVVVGARSKFLSFHGGTGKSNIIANVAALLAAGGRRVGVIDTDVHSPGIHVLFSMDAGGNCRKFPFLA